MSFATDVHPLFVEKCGGCHAEGDGADYPGHAADDVDAAYAATTADNTSGTPMYERILVRVRGEDPNGMMPPNFSNPPCMGVLDASGCLTTEEVELIQEWVDGGRAL